MEGKHVRICVGGLISVEKISYMITEESAPGDNKGYLTSSSYTGFLRWVPEELTLLPLPFTKMAREETDRDSRILG